MWRIKPCEWDTPTPIFGDSGWLSDAMWHASGRALAWLAHGNVNRDGGEHVCRLLRTTKRRTIALWATTRATARATTRRLLRNWLCLLPRLAK